MQAIAADWLGEFNALRALARLPLVTENATWSAGDQLHARYEVKNQVIGHTEDPANPWYTLDGAAAAQASNVLVNGIATSDADAIDIWMTAPFHQVGMLAPGLRQTGFGSYREAVSGFQMGAALDVIRGLGVIPPSVVYPIMFPTNHSIMPFRSFYGGEFPDPLSGCPGYTLPTSAPIVLELPTTPSVTAYSFTRGGTPLAVCAFDETTYRNPDASTQDLGRAVLGAGRHAIVLMPQLPLELATNYEVSITSSGVTYSWSFGTTGAPACSPRPPVHVTVALSAPGRLSVTISTSAGNVFVRQLSFGLATNALIDIGSLAGQTGNFAVSLPANTPRTSFVLRRVGPGAATVPLIVTDSCGDWPTFVGGGPSAF